MDTVNSSGKARGVGVSMGEKKVTSVILLKLKIKFKISTNYFNLYSDYNRCIN